MKNHPDRFQSFFAAAAFAEAGEYHTAVQISTDYAPKKRTSVLSAFTRIFAAAAFAEEGLHEEARRIGGLEERAAPAPSLASFLDSVGLSDAQVHYVTVRA